MSAEFNLSYLKERAKMLSQVRNFFSKRNVLEVDCFAIDSYATIDAFIDPVEVYPEDDLLYYLHTSPEYKMKRLLSQGIGDIYQLSHVFRKKEMSSKHFPEFTMIEWYRINQSFEFLIDEVCQLISLFTGKKEVKAYTFLDAFEKFGTVASLTNKNLEKTLVAHKLPFSKEWTTQEKMHFAWSEIIEKKFDPNCFTVITDFPKEEAALAVIENGLAKRFEVYHQGFELANGYKELRCPNEQRERFIRQNALRKQMGKKTFDLPKPLIEALEHGLPPCVGVAVGFDRLLMIKTGATSIKEVIF